MDDELVNMDFSSESHEELALLYELGIALASGKDLFSTLVTLQTAILKLVRAEAMFVAIYDKDTDIVEYPIYFEVGMPQRQSSRRLSQSPGLTGAVIQNGKTLYLPDMDADEVSNTYAPVNDDQEFVLRTFLGIPLMVNNSVFGVLSVQSTSVDAYSADQIQLMENVAIQAALAIDKTRLLDRLKKELAERTKAEADLRQRESMLEAVTFAAEQFLKTSNWRQNIDVVLERLGKVFRATHAYLFEHHPDEHGDRVSSMQYEWTALGYHSDLNTGEFQNTTSFAEEVESTDGLLRKGVVFIGNTSTYPPIERERLIHLGIKAMIEVPLFVRDEWWGTIGLDDMEVEREWRASEIDALKVAAGILSAAIQRQEAESTVRESERMYREAIEVADAVPYLRYYDPNTYVFMGEGIQGITGYTSREMTPQLWGQIVIEVQMTGELAALTEQEGIQLVRTGKVKGWKCDYLIRTRDGRARWIADSAIELFGDLPFSYGSIGIMQDVTERKLVEKNLRQRESLLHALTFSAEQFLRAADWRETIDQVLTRLGTEFNVSHAYLFEKHPDVSGVIVTSLRYEWTAPGCTSDLGNPDYQYIEPGGMGFERFYEILDSGEPLVGDARFFNEFEKQYIESVGMQALLEIRVIVDGEQWGTLGVDETRNERIWSDVEINVLKVASSMLGAAIKRQRDESMLQNELSQRKTLINELESKNQELERFTYTVSHDLKSPLVTISGFLGYLEQDGVAGNFERFHEDAQRIREAVSKMQKLLSELLELSRIGRMMHAPELIPFNDLIHEALAIVHGQLEEKNITVHTQPDLPSVYGDRRRLIEVLQNLLDNAAKYRGDQPVPLIEIGQAGEENGKPVFFIKDNGMGIAPEHHERIFGLFNKLDVKTEGTGVGLALVKRIVEVHEGRIWVESESGKGATFLFTLPPQPPSDHSP